MKKFLFVTLVLAMIVYLTGCGKKQQPLEEMQQPMSMEELSRLNTQTATVPESKTQVTQATPAAETKLESLPPAGPYKPTGQEIQTALKNAGYYTGLIDGKIGPQTKKAIEEFQKANGLQTDGKVGPKTWSVLSKHLNPEPAPVEKKRKR
jgi:peptidoglycan hydrolase-like protein with peptidoglycan-binding domain